MERVNSNKGEFFSNVSGETTQVVCGSFILK